MQKVIDAFLQQLPHYLTTACDRVMASGNPVYKSWPMANLRAAVGRVYQAVGEDLVSGGMPQAIPALMERIGAQRVQAGVRISQMLAGMGQGYEVVSEDMQERFHDDPAAFAWWDRARARLSYAGAAALADAYMTARTQEARAQEEEIFRLSAPLLPLYPGILLLPVIGRLDDARASQVTMAMLAAIVTHASRVVLIDVTGLPTLDVTVAQRLLTAGKAVQLVGAVPVVVGLSPTMAKLVIEGGIDLSGIQTRGNLGDGLQYALGILGKTITSSALQRR